MKNILTKLLLILLLAGMTLSLASCNKSNDEYAAPSGFMTASAESADFYFYVPDDWTVDYTTAAAGAYFSASDPSSVSVMAWDLEYSDTTVDEWWELNQGEIESVFQNFNLESEENTTIESVQFVIKTAAIQPNAQAQNDVQEEVTLTFWQKLLKLFGLYK